MQLWVNAADKIPLSKFMIKRCQRLPQVWRDLATHWGWRVKLQLSSNFTMDHVPLQNEALPCRYIILSWKLLPGPGPSKCTWAWADVKIINITVYYSSIKFWFLSIDGLWLTFYYLLHPDYHEYWQPLTWNTKVKTSGGFANIAQLLHVPGLPVHALGGEKVHSAFALQKWLHRCRVKPENTWKYGDVDKSKLIMNEHMTNSLVLVVLRRIPICDISDPLGHV